MIKSTYFKLIYRVIGFLSKLIIKFKVPWVTKHIEYADVDFIQKCHLQEGDIILTRTNGWLSTLIIPGYFSHLAIYIGGGYIIDATTNPGVSIRYLADLCLKADSVAIMRCKDLTELQIQVGLSFIYRQQGKPYDFEMELKDDSARFCSELGMLYVNKAKGFEYIEARETLGIPTFTPNDCYLARKKFELIWEKTDK